MKHIAYIAGGMKGYPFYNHFAFDSASRLWEACGHMVISPAEYDREGGNNPYELPYDHDWNNHWENPPLADCYMWDIEAILRRATCVALLPYWEKSVGTRGEVAVAQVAGLSFYEAFSMQQLHIEANFTSVTYA